MNSSKNIAINYRGGCGGHFIHHFLLASGKYSTDFLINNVKIKVKAGDFKKIRQQFYLQFNTSRKWLAYELWPDNSKQDDNTKLLLNCNPTELDPSTVNLCPFIRDRKDWFRTILYKRTNLFRGKKIDTPLIRKEYTDLMNDTEFSTKIQGCDYYFEITDFVNNLSHRSNLCEFLSIPHNDLMEEFVAHYNNCHKDLRKKTSW